MSKCKNIWFYTIL